MPDEFINGPSFHRCIYIELKAGTKVLFNFYRLVYQVNTLLPNGISIPFSDQIMIFSHALQIDLELFVFIMSNVQMCFAWSLKYFNE